MVGNYVDKVYDTFEIQSMFANLNPVSVLYHICSLPSSLTLKMLEITLIGKQLIHCQLEISANEGTFKSMSPLLSLYVCRKN